MSCQCGWRGVTVLTKIYPVKPYLISLKLKYIPSNLILSAKTICLNPISTLYMVYPLNGLPFTNNTGSPSKYETLVLFTVFLERIEGLQWKQICTKILLFLLNIIEAFNRCVVYWLGPIKGVKWYLSLMFSDTTCISEFWARKNTNKNSKYLNIQNMICLFCTQKWKKILYSLKLNLINLIKIFLTFRTQRRKVIFLKDEMLSNLFLTLFIQKLLSIEACLWKSFAIYFNTWK